MQLGHNSLGSTTAGYMANLVDEEPPLAETDGDDTDGVPAPRRTIVRDGQLQRADEAPCFTFLSV